MSFLGFSASASSANPPASLALLKSELKAVPSGSLGQGRGGRSGKGKKKPLLRTFNPVGTVPRVSGLGMQMISAQLTSTQAELFSTSNVAPTFKAYSFYLSSFAGAGPYTNLFDQYILDEVEFWLTPESPQGTTVFGQVTSAVDFDDANVPTTNLMVADKQSSVVTAGGAATYIRFAPHMAVAVYSGAFTSFGNEPAQWIDAASASVQHYGVKLSLSPTPTPIAYCVSYRGHFRFRQPGIA